MIIVKLLRNFSPLYQEHLPGFICKLSMQDVEEEEEGRRLKVKLGELRISSAERYILSYRYRLQQATVGYNRL